MGALGAYWLAFIIWVIQILCSHNYRASFINKHVRADERNQLLIRLHMTREDDDEYQRQTSESAEI